MRPSHLHTTSCERLGRCEIDVCWLSVTLLRCSLSPSCKQRQPSYKRGSQWNANESVWGNWQDSHERNHLSVATLCLLVHPSNRQTQQGTVAHLRRVLAGEHSLPWSPQTAHLASGHETLRVQGTDRRFSTHSRLQLPDSLSASMQQQHK